MDKETLDVYDERAEEYRDFDKNAVPDTQLQAFLDALPQSADILDLGCGPGRSAAMIANAGHRVTATDASAEMVRLASGHPGVDSRQETFDDISGDAIYDGVFANFSLLHARREDLSGHLEALSKALRPSGVLHIGMKTGDGMVRDGLGRRYTYVTHVELDDLLKSVGLQPGAFWTGEDVGLAGTKDPWIVIHATKNA